MDFHSWKPGCECPLQPFPRPPPGASLSLAPWEPLAPWKHSSWANHSPGCQKQRPSSPSSLLLGKWGALKARGLGDRGLLPSVRLQTCAWAAAVVFPNGRVCQFPPPHSTVGKLRPRGGAMTGWLSVTPLSCALFARPSF